MTCPNGSRQYILSVNRRSLCRIHVIATRLATPASPRLVQNVLHSEWSLPPVQLHPCTKHQPLQISLRPSILGNRGDTCSWAAPEPSKSRSAAMASGCNRIVTGLSLGSWLTNSSASFSSSRWLALRRRLALSLANCLPILRQNIPGAPS